MRAQSLAAATANINEARARAAQLKQIAADLEGDIGELTKKRATAVDAQGREDLAQRLAGKTAPPAKGIGAIDADLESRRTTLAAAQTAKAEAEAPLLALIEEADAARRRLRHALQRTAELEYFELLPTVLPVAARLVALQSRLCRFESIEIQVDREMLGAGHHALREEIGA